MEKPPGTGVRQHAAFFRQSGWLMCANVAGGAMTWGVHFLAKRIPEEQYSIFGTLLMVTAVLPTIPLQMVMAQQTASTLATNRKRELSGMIRVVSWWTLIIWAVAAAVTLLFQVRIVHRWELTSPVALYVTLLAVLASIWMPLFSGVLLGRQNFLWLGWSMILGGAGRLAVAAVIVLALSGGASGMMIGVLLGAALTGIIGAWQSRDLWSLPRADFDRASFVRQIVPLLLGFGAFQFLFTTDTMYAMAFSTSEQMAPYVAAGTLSRALLWLVLPLASVMFPKIVHSSTRSEKSGLMRLVLPGTAVLAIGGGAALWLVGPWVIKLVYTSKYVAGTMALLPWYAGAMVPLALANVLLNDLMARSRFRVVPAAVLVAAAYGIVLPILLKHYPGKLEVVLQTMGVFNLLLLVVCAWGAFRDPPSPVAKPQPV